MLPKCPTSYQRTDLKQALDVHTMLLTISVSLSRNDIFPWPAPPRPLRRRAHLVQPRCWLPSLEQDALPLLEGVSRSLNELRPSSRVASWVSLNELLSLPPLAGRCASETVRHPCTASPCCMAPGRAQSKSPCGPRALQQRAEDNQSSPRRRSRRNFPSATFALRSAWITTAGRALADSGYGFAAIPLMRMCPSLPVWRALLASL